MEVTTADVSMESLETLRLRELSRERRVGSIEATWRIKSVVKWARG